MRPTNHLCSIYPISATLIEGSDAEAMLHRFPQAGSHDNLHYIFAGAPENAVSNLPEIEEGNEQDMIDFALANLATGLIGTKSQIGVLHNAGVCCSDVIDSI